MIKRLILSCALGSIAGAILISMNPVNNKMFNLLFLACFASAWAGLTILTWPYRPMRIITLLIPVLCFIPFILPGGKMDSEKLREDYLRRMSNLEETKYLWGGESSRGIDCSGLPRRALRDALLAYGIRHGNGAAFRSYLEQWWFDSSAKALSEGYRNYTVPLETTGTIREMNYDGLIPGDLAVTADGIHILAYLGEDLWIQADPGLRKVKTLNGRTAENRWFDIPVTTYRWKLLVSDAGS